MKPFDIIVAGGGHAGIEAAVSAARLGMQTALVTMDKDKIGLMSCNPAIGGLAKGQLVRELDALGGIMGRIADEAGIHFKMLNTSKGPAVQSPRAQTDRLLYASIAQKYVFSIPGLTVIEDTGIGIEVSKNRVSALIMSDGKRLPARAVILTAGTFLNGVIYIGLNMLPAGRAGELPAEGMTESLNALGFVSKRLKTGTPPRVHRDTIDYTKTITQEPDETPVPFSYSTEYINRRQVNCYITHTNPATHDILREGFEQSPMFTGRIKGVGPRYCPSIEDKVNRFSDKDHHQLFLEPEGYDNAEIYVNGFSSSLPAPIQERALHSVAGLEKAKIIRLAYAVEYDFFPPNQLKYTFETKPVENLYFAGQINGTSGYEEAAVQGFVAGVNAALKLKGAQPFRVDRSEAYIGVLIDDLINKLHNEPYRMFTSRAEFRLLLRHDNADLRLMEKGHALGLIGEKTYEKFTKRRESIAELRKKITEKKISPKSFNERYARISSPLRQSVMMVELVKRPEIKLCDLLALSGENGVGKSIIDEVEFDIKYKGYIVRQQDQIEKVIKLEGKKIPEGMNYMNITALSQEAREKLHKIRPLSLGQASRISGVTPADVSVLMVYLEKYRLLDVSRET